MSERIVNKIGWLNLTQFLGALNDNVLKLLIILYLIRIQGVHHAGSITAFAGAAFVLPFLLFSAPAGCLADRFAKSRVVTAVKVIEVAVTALAVLAFRFGLDALLYAVLFMMGTHSALFAPAKYGALPELVEKEQLSRANGIMESTTFLAIIVGTALASILVQVTGASTWWAGCCSLVIAAAGLLSAWKMPPTQCQEPQRRIALLPTEIVKTIAGIRGDRHLVLAMTGLAYFMFIAAFAQLNLIGYGIERLGLTEVQSGYLFLAAALGIGIGSLLAGKASGRDVEFGIVPIGAAGLGLAPVLLHVVPAGLTASLAIIAFFGISAGFFSLPLQTFIQFRAEPARRGEVLAASSFLNWVAILAASGCTWIFSGPLSLSAAQGFSVVGIATLGLAALSLWILPDFLVRFIALVVMRIFYRIRIEGRNNLPVDGAALLIPNHVSWIDALLLTATNQRRIRFVMERSIYNTPVLHSLFKLMGVIPVSSSDSRKEIVEFIKRSRAALDDGYLVCIFAEGHITRNGMLHEFRGGFERIVKESDHPIIPVYIGGAWGSILSYAHGRLLSRPPALAPYPITILFGAPMPSTAKAVEVRQAVSELSCDYFETRKASRRSLGDYFLRCAKENWKRRAVADTSGKSLTYGETATGALALAAKLEPVVGEGEHVGVLLPPCAGAVLTNLALTISGKVPVNLNYTAAEASIRSAVSQCGISRIVTSQAFLEKVPSLRQLPGMICLEEIIPTVSAHDKAKAWVRARFLPASRLCKGRGFDPDRPATVIFSSGSTGEPKGVILTHHNIMSNLEGLRMVFRVDLNDNICSALPFFHSFGFTGTLWFPLVSGFSAAYHTNPLDGEVIARVVREHRSTLLLATPTFLMSYLRRAKKEDFASLRLVVTGAEKLHSRVVDAFEAKFAIRPFEGYGATELSPVISLNLPDVEIDGVRQYGSKQGSVGHPIPGVSVRVADPDTLSTLGAGEQGMILVKGPNVMSRYLGKSEETAQVIRDGWYLTGDIGVLDEDGFVRITDRLSRFSKIGGEMVPHGAVEEELQNRLGQSGVVAVTAVADEKKGEKLVVIFCRETTDAETLQRHLSESDLPNLWKPARDCLVGVESLPVLGTGKLDLRGLRNLAAAALG